MLPETIRPSFGRFWEFIYPSGLQGPEGVTILYVIVPWIGVMAAGYGFGLIFSMDEKRRRKICLMTGLAMTAAFLIAGSHLVYRNSSAENVSPFWMQLLNQNKYPASQLFLLMTLGPLLALVPLAERTKGRLAKGLDVFGKVPLFFYLLHIPLIHLSALLVNMINYGKSLSGFYDTAPYCYLPDEYKWSLPLVYLVFIVNIALLFLACRWYLKINATHPAGWLRYI